MRSSLALLIGIVAVAPVLLAHSTGAPARKTNGPGDTGTCTSSGCHTGTALNGGGGSVRITAADGTTYTPGQRQRLTVTITDSAARGYGFEASARLGTNLAGGQAGTLHTVNNETRLMCSDENELPCRAADPVQFITHTNPKSTNTFEFDWTPPADASAGDVTIYVAANAANLNQQNTGDRIYTTTLTLSPQVSKPAISSNGVINGASFESGFSSGSWVTIKGTNLAATTRTWDNDFKEGQAPTELEGVRVNIDGKPAAVYYISPEQINVQAPALDKTGNVAVEVVNRNGTSNTGTGDVRAAAPGWFMFDPENRKYIAGAHHPDGTFLGKPGLFGGAVTTRAAKPGDIIVLYGANFGPTTPAMPIAREVSQASPLQQTPSVTIGGQPAPVLYGGGAPNLIGTYQFNITVPDVPNGDHEVVVQVGSVRTQSNAFITIQR